MIKLRENDDSMKIPYRNTVYNAYYGAHTHTKTQFVGDKRQFQVNFLYHSVVWLNDNDDHDGDGDGDDSYDCD